MLKRLGMAVLIVSVLVVGLAGIALAQDATPPAADACPYGEACGGYGQGGHGMRGYGYAGSMPTLLAEALGMTTEELYAAQTAGQTVAEIAADQGVELADVVAAVIAPQAERLAQAVVDGRLTQEQVDLRLATMTEQMTSRFETLTGDGVGCGRWGSGEFGPSDDTGSFGGRGRRGGANGGRWPASQGTDA